LTKTLSTETLSISWRWKKLPDNFVRDSVDAGDPCGEVSEVLYEVVDTKAS